MHSVGSNRGGLQSAGQLFSGHEHKQLRRGVCAEHGEVPVCDALKIVRVEPAKGVDTRAQIDDSTLLTPVQVVEQKVGEEERREIVDLEHRLVAVLGFGACWQKHASVVD